MYKKTRHSFRWLSTEATLRLIFDSQYYVQPKVPYVKTNMTEWSSDGLANSHSRPSNGAVERKRRPAEPDLFPREPATGHCLFQLYVNRGDICARLWANERARTHTNTHVNTPDKHSKVRCPLSPLRLLQTVCRNPWPSWPGTENLIEPTNVTFAPPPLPNRTPNWSLMIET